MRLLIKSKTILLDPKIVDSGTMMFHNILSHEAIHVAQSCSAGALDLQPKRIGLPLSFSPAMDTKLSHHVYSDNTEEALYMEREAYSYAKESGAALYLIDKYC